MISIAIPTYNRGHLIGQTLAGIDAILPLSVPIVIRDNGSTDQTRTVIELFSSRTSRIVIYSNNEENIGIDQNIFRVINDCTTRYVWLMGDDDLPEPNAWEEISTIFEKHSDLAVIILNYRVWDSKLEKAVSAGVIEGEKREYFESGIELLPKVGELLCFLSILIIDREKFINAMSAVGYFPKNTAVDFVSPIIKILKKYPALLSTFPTIRFRSGDEDRGFNRILVIWEYITILEKLLRENKFKKLIKSSKLLMLKRYVIPQLRLRRNRGDLTMILRITIFKTLAAKFWGYKIFWTKGVPQLLIPKKISFSKRS